MRWSAAARARASERLQERWADPDYRSVRVAGLRKAQADPETAAKRAQGYRAYLASGAKLGRPRKTDTQPRDRAEERAGYSKGPPADAIAAEDAGSSLAWARQHENAIRFHKARGMSRASLVRTYGHAAVSLVLGG